MFGQVFIEITCPTMQECKTIFAAPCYMYVLMFLMTEVCSILHSMYPRSLIIWTWTIWWKLTGRRPSSINIAPSPSCSRASSPQSASSPTKRLNHQPTRSLTGEVILSFHPHDQKYAADFKKILSWAAPKIVVHVGCSQWRRAFSSTWHCQTYCGFPFAVLRGVS